MDSLQAFFAYSECSFSPLVSFIVEGCPFDAAPLVYSASAAVLLSYPPERSLYSRLTTQTAQARPGCPSHDFYPFGHGVSFQSSAEHPTVPSSRLTVAVRINPQLSMPSIHVYPQVHILRVFLAHLPSPRCPGIVQEIFFFRIIAVRVIFLTSLVC